ncbi:hypothetical protein M419DRAFT_117748 [Trichoderma reesei RUT C-30]|uniref:Secreted protein n=1 Tax=Hypocrea jecorina (strain ATCC 56765 / BCRC 32924 / NRRL 11460 / Rut C-30) TaxID=1344414 RepID=A0A024SIR2_HYPJR|nr:hypothetical protein M419DRAFT_117748 [Trichoderma reesei RUT C-30]
MYSLWLSLCVLCSLSPRSPLLCVGQWRKKYTAQTKTEKKQKEEKEEQAGQGKTQPQEAVMISTSGNARFAGKGG